MTIPGVDQPYSPIPELSLLKSFDEETADFYAGRFALRGYLDDLDVIATWSDEADFTRRCLPFGHANSTGSIYALWKVDDRPDLADLPVIAFGDEGGICLVARDLRALFEILAQDGYVHVDHGGVSVEDESSEDYAHTPGNRAFVVWLREYFAVAPAVDPAEIIAAAEEEYLDRFEAWLAACGIG